MKVFINKGILFKLIVCLCIFLVLFNFTGTSQVYAADEPLVAKAGGVLLSPVLDLLMVIGDGILNLIQNAIMETPAMTTLDVSTGIWIVVSVIVGILMAAGVIIASILLAGLPVFASLSGIAASLAGTLIAGVATVVALGAGVGLGSACYMFGKATFLPDYSVIPTVLISPQEIFEGDLLIFDINFFTPKTIMVATYPQGGDPDDESTLEKGTTIEEWDETDGNGNYVNRNGREVAYYYYINNSGEEVATTKQSAAASLSRVISNWYYTIRNVAIVALMVILIYVGIRMLLTSIASEKSKYKKMLGDWIVALCLVFVLHYIMIFAVNINDNIISIMKSINSENTYVYVIQLDADNTKSQNLVKALVEAGFTEYITDAAGDSIPEDTTDPVADAGDGMFVYPTNLIGQTRLAAQQLDGGMYIGYSIAYLVLVFYTVFFVFTYLKRVLMMAFLTVIAPLVAVTYPIDKISDGHAQAFNVWLKEYIFNLLIQPVHLLLYVLLISMAFELAGQNIVYTLVAIGFMIPAEKFIRSMFGFDKAKTPGFLGGAAGAALTVGAMQGLANLGKRLPHGNNNKVPVGSGGNGQNSEQNDIYNRSADSGKGFENLLGNSGQDTPQVGNNGQDMSQDANDDFSIRLNTGNQNSNGSNNDQNDSTGLDNLINMPNNQGAQMDADMQDDLLDRNQSGLTADEQMEYDALNDELSNLSNEDMYLNPDEYSEKQARLDELQQKMGTSTGDDTISLQDVELVENALGENQNINDNEPDESQQPEQEKTKEEQLEELRKKHKWSENLKDPGIWRDALGRSIQTSGKILGAAVGVGLGVASGIASGDPSNVAKNAAIGGTSGGLLGGSVTGVAADVVDGTTGSKMRRVYNKNRDAYLSRRYGADASKVKKIEKDLAFKKDKNARKLYATEFESELVG